MSRHSGSVSDEELLTQLAAAFPVEPVEPEPSSLHRLSLAVAELHPTGTAPGPRRRTTRLRTRRLSLPGRLSPVVSAGTLVGALVMGTGISYAVGVPIPNAVRSVARTVGLAAPAPKAPTLSPVDAAQRAASALHQALTDSDSTSAELSHDSSALAHKLAQVSGDHSRGAERVGDDGHHLLDQACRQMGGSPGSGTDSSHDGACASADGDGQHGSGSSPDSSSTGTATTAPSGGGGDGGGDHGTDGGSAGRTQGGSGDGSTAPSGGARTDGSSGGSTSGGPTSGTSDGGGDKHSISDGGSSSGQSTPSTSATPTTQPSDGGSGGGSEPSGSGSSGGPG
jgi:hypothetical protein